MFFFFLEMDFLGQDFFGKDFLRQRLSIFVNELISFRIDVEGTSPCCWSRFSIEIGINDPLDEQLARKIKHDYSFCKLFFEHILIHYCCIGSRPFIPKNPIDLVYRDVLSFLSEMSRFFR